MTPLLVVVTITSLLAAESKCDVEISEPVPETLEFLVSSKNEISRVSGAKKYAYPMPNSNYRVVDVDYHSEKDLLLWIDGANQEIHSQPLSVNWSGPRMTYRRPGTWKPIALAVDSVNDKIYVVDEDGRTIDLFELSGRYRCVALGLLGPSDIELDSYARLLFVVDGTRLLRMNMDGSNQVVIHARPSRYYGLSINILSQTLFWVDVYSDDIVAYNYTSANPNVFKINATAVDYRKFAVHENKVYRVFDRTSPCPCDEYKTHKVTPTIKILNPLSQTSGHNPCQENDNGGCAHMCILTSLGSEARPGGEFECACQFGWKLDGDFTNCSRVREFMIYEQAGYGVLKSHTVDECLNGFCEPYFPVKNKGLFSLPRIKSFDYDSRTGYLYYLVTGLGPDAIYKTQLNASTKPELVPVYKPRLYESLAIDQRTGHLYLASPINGQISVFRYDRPSPESIKYPTEHADFIKMVSIYRDAMPNVIVENLRFPRSIAVHRGFVFFKQGLAPNASLARVNVDGSNLTIPEKLITRVFALDRQADRVYWYNGIKVQHCNLDFQDIKTINIFELPRRIPSMAVYKRWVYLVDTDKAIVWRMDKVTGEYEASAIPNDANVVDNLKIFGPGKDEEEERKKDEAKEEEQKNK